MTLKEGEVSTGMSLHLYVRSNLFQAYFRHKRNVTLSVQIGFFRHIDSVFRGHTHTKEQEKFSTGVYYLFGAL